MSEDGSVSVEFDVAEHERYTVLTIAAWRGIADRPGSTLGVSVRGGHGARDFLKDVSGESQPAKCVR